MRITVNNSVDVRHGEPKFSAPTYQHLVAGSEIEVDNKMYPGDQKNGISTWYKDAADNYYWSGDLSPDDGSDLLYPGWMVELKIPEIWKYSTGKDVGVAVVDTGVDINNKDLPYNKDKYYVYDSNHTLEDKDGHGTHCLGLIGARNNSGHKIGIAPECNLFVCKISEKSNFTEQQAKRYADAINWCSGQDDIHVISISWSSFITDKKTIAAIQIAIDLAIKRKKVVVCAMGNASHFNDPGPIYPAMLNNTIGIGSIPVDNILYPYINRSLTTATQGVKIESYGLNKQLIRLTGTSQSNAILAGLVSLLIKKNDFKYTPDEIRDILMKSSDPVIYNKVIIPVIRGDMILKYFQI
ncbi:MAG: S8/S53 family peptidase [Bacteroidota bacterium]